MYCFIMSHNTWDKLFILFLLFDKYNINEKINMNINWWKKKSPTRFIYSIIARLTFKTISIIIVSLL